MLEWLAITRISKTEAGIIDILLKKTYYKKIRRKQSESLKLIKRIRKVLSDVSSGLNENPVAPNPLVATNVKSDDIYFFLFTIINLPNLDLFSQDYIIFVFQTFLSLVKKC